MLRKTAVSAAAVVFLTLILPVFKPAFAFEGGLLAQINSYRQSKGLAAVKTDPYTCSFAQTRAQEIASGFSHSGFYNRVGSKSLPYPRYHLVTENLAWTPGGQNPVDMWINSPAHNANLLKNTPIVCVERHGNYVAFEGWRP